MTKLVQISILLFTIISTEVTSVTIFEGISVKKGIDVTLFPFSFPSIAFIKEKWLPFGGFGIKHVIARRQVINVIEPKVIVTPVPAYVVPEVPRPEHPPVAPVVEHHEEPDIPMENVVHEPEIPLIKPPVAPVIEHEVSETPPIPAAIEEPVPVIVPSEPVLVTPAGIAPVLIPPAPIPIQAPPLPLLVPTPVSNNFNTIPPVIVQESAPPSLLAAFLPKGGLRTGSKLAIQLGSAFLHFMTQVFSSPQSPFAK